MKFDIGKHMEALMETTTVATGEHPTFMVKSKGRKDFLGMVEWYEPWHGYIFAPEDSLVLSHDCCTEMGKFLLNRTLAETEKKS